MKHEGYILYSNLFFDVAAVFEEDELEKYQKFIDCDSTYEIKDAVWFDSFEEFETDCEYLEENEEEDEIEEDE